jgi:hypothetical protein
MGVACVCAVREPRKHTRPSADQGTPSTQLRARAPPRPQVLLEQAMEAEEESIVNRLQRQLEALSCSYRCEAAVLLLALWCV